MGRRYVRRKPRRTTRHNIQTVAAIARLTAPTSARASQGCAKASASPPTTATSSVADAVQLLTGSGEVLSTARAPDLSRWLRSEDHTSELQSLMRHPYAV